MDVREALIALIDLDLDDAGADDVRAGLSASARVRSWLEAWDIAARRRLDDLARDGAPIFPDADLMNHGKSSQREASKIARRQGALDLVPDMADPLADGDVTGSHVDALANGLGQLDKADRQKLAVERGAELAELAKQQSADEFEKTVKQAVADAHSDGGVGRLERQKRAVRLRTWWDKITGMLQISGQLDPETGMQLVAKLRGEVERMFHGGVGDDCPADPSARQEYLMAQALIRLVLGNTAAPVADGQPGRPTPTPRTDMSVVIGLDLLTNGGGKDSVLDLGHPDTVLPVETLRRMACVANIIPVVLGGDGVVLDVGRGSRLATPAQRAALRVMYPTCGVHPGCRVPFDGCEIHHIDPWGNLGPTDLGKLLPACTCCHHRAHEGGWKLDLDPVTRVLTITLPDGTILTNRPPRARAPAA